MGQLIEFQAAAKGDDDDDDDGGPVARAPEWIPLFPNKRKVEARDGRVWEMDDPDAVIAAFNDDTHADLMVDWDHNAADVGYVWSSVNQAPAAGWIKELRKKGKRGIEGRVEWTEAGRASVEGKDYRYISPWFQTTSAEYDEDGNVVALPKIRNILNAALVNMPALRMSALTRRQTQPTAATAGATMNAAILARLGLPETATEADALTAIDRLKEANTTPDPANFVPKADYDAVTTARTTAETERDEARAALAERDKVAVDDAIEAALDDAIAQKKIAPSTRDYHRKTMARAGGADEFRSEFLATAAPVIPTTPRDEPTLPKAGEFTVAKMNDADRVAAKRMMLTDEQFVATRNHEQQVARDRLEG